MKAKAKTKTKTKTVTKILDTNNHYYKLLEKKFHSSDIVRSQIAEIKERVKKTVIEEPLKSLAVSFNGEVVGNSFEKTLKIITKHLFRKGKIDCYKTDKERGVVDAYITATETEVEELIQFLMKKHLVLHCKTGLPKGASNMLIIDEKEKKLLGDFEPDDIGCNQVSTAETREKYTGRLEGYLIHNGLPLTTKTLGSELRLNEIVTSNKVFTSTGLKEVFLNLHFITLVIMLDLEQHYFQYRIFKEQEEDLKEVEDNIDNLGLFTELFDHLTNEGNPLLFNNELFMDVLKLEHIVEKDNWKVLPAYDSYVYSATNKLDAHFKFLEEYGLLQKCAESVELLIEKLEYKLSGHNFACQSEQDDLSSNYQELKEFRSIPNHSLLKNDFLELLGAFRKLLVYLDSMSVQGPTKQDDIQKKAPVLEKPARGLVATLKERAKSLLSSPAESSPESVSHEVSHNENALTTEQKEDILILLSQVKEGLRKTSRLKTDSGVDAYIEARKNVPYLTNLSGALDQLKKLIKDINKNKDVQEQFQDLFNRKNKFVILSNKLSKLVKFKTKQEEKKICGILTDLQTLLHDKPFKEDKYVKFIDNVNKLEVFVNSKDVSSMKQEGATLSLAQEMDQDKTFNKVLNIKTGIQNIIEKSEEISKISTFKNDREFLSFSQKELDGFLEELIVFNKKLKVTTYYGKQSDFEKIEKEFDKLIEQANDIEARIKSRRRSDNNTVFKESDQSIDYTKNSMIKKKSLEKTIIGAQYQISQLFEFIETVKGFLGQDSFVHSGVATSSLFDQITYLLSNTDVKLLDFTSLTEDMYNESIKTIFQYQVGETFNEPKKGDIERLMKKIEKKAIVKTYKSKK
ncbi:indolepyruvate ferredoxin oxidoreductase, alpha and beta subunits [Candidatus Scalindua japonica]|uniref:Indolepyruvate ferredoxin oxidoreductase, alpha and beta subunits n=1 Tax=Candidatus Scalindua japonica TaxID=1284222 RepID=A0A286TYN0_9BACT|nr:hypothetical protein [Candidatus Scalindua japonica]GAX60976.1 indolepyruvate ferredoxin oxidoreductase, alpha and beta subunits [Candidatus Scalindua japonica]